MANTLVLRSSLFTPISDNLSIWLPNTILFALMFTLSHTALVTYSLSPVNTMTLIPCLFRFLMVSLALSFGGSKNPINPNNTMSFSSCTAKCSTFSMLFF